MTCRDLTRFFSIVFIINIDRFRFPLPVALQCSFIFRLAMVASDPRRAGIVLLSLGALASAAAAAAAPAGASTLTKGSLTLKLTEVVSELGMQ